MTDLVSYLPLILGLMAAGVASGLLAGLLGVGGGIVLVPAMSIAFGFLGYSADVIHHVAVGTSLAIIIASGTSSTLAHYKCGAVMLDIVKIWSPFIIIAALLGGLMARLYSGDMLRIIFAIIALLVAINILLPFQQRLIGKLHQSKFTHRIIAFVVGYISALMGIGGGSLSVPTLTSFGHSIHKSVGTGAALGVLIAIPATIGFIISGLGVAGRPEFSIGYINIPALILIGIIATIVAPFGAAIAHKIDARKLKLTFAVFLVIVSARMIYQVFWG